MLGEKQQEHYSSLFAEGAITPSAGEAFEKVQFSEK